MAKSSSTTAKANYEVRLRFNHESRPNLVIECATELLAGGGLRARWDVGTLGRWDGGTERPKAKNSLLRQPELSIKTLSPPTLEFPNPVLYIVITSI